MTTMKKIIPNHIPALGWKGGFLQKHPEMTYPNPDLSGLPLTDNLANIGNIERQQRALWPEFTWETQPGKKDPKRCFQMFAPDISRVGYDSSGQSWSVICPQQGVFLEGIGTLNVEVTVTGQKGWVNESNQTMAIDMIVKPKVWFSPSATKSSLGKLMWAVFELNHVGFHFPSEKKKAIQLNTFATTKQQSTTLLLRDGLFMKGKLPAFTEHFNEAWSHAHVEVEIGEIDKSSNALVTEFNELIMKIFNIGSGNMLKQGSTLAWNIWFDAPTLADQTEWRDHATFWRNSIDVEHCSPDGDGTPPRFANGKPFNVEKEFLNEVTEEIKEFIKKHL